MKTPTFTFTMDLAGIDPVNHGNDISSALHRASVDIGGKTADVDGGTVEDIQGRVLASWEVTEPTDRPRAFTETETALLNALKEAWALLHYPDVRFLICDGSGKNLGEQAQYHSALNSARKLAAKYGERI